MKVAAKRGKGDKRADKHFPTPSSCVPPTIKVVPREPRQEHHFEATAEQELPINPYTEFEIPEKWPGDEEALVFDFGVSTNKEFVQTLNIVHPPSLSDSPDILLVEKRLPEYFKAFKYKEPKETDFDLKRSNSMAREVAIPLMEKTKNLLPFEIHRRKKIITFEDCEYEENGVISIRVCDYKEREETTEEQEERKLREENSKIKKKTDKKKDQHEPNMIKVPYMGKVSIEEVGPLFSRWIGSILQTISERNIKDCETGHSILQNIYPQEDGIPIYNPTGRYWVKLYYLGMARKIEIDDKMPINGMNRMVMYAKSRKITTIWPYILSKAISTLFSFKWTGSIVQSEVGESAVMHALTGLIPCSLSSKDLALQWDLIKQLMNDENHKNGFCYAVGYCNEDKKPSFKTNKVDEKLELKLLIEHEAVHPLSIRKDLAERGDARDVNNGIPSYMKPGVAYSIFDYFTNDRFNMVYAQGIPEAEIKLRSEYLNLMMKTTNPKQTKEENFELKIKRKMYKNRIKEEDKRRMELMRKGTPKFYRLLKLSSNLRDSQQLQVFSVFSDKEITTAKTCILSNLSRPPNFYDFYDTTDNKSLLSGQVSNKQVSALETVLEAAKKDLGDFSSVSHHKVPLKRDPGIWINEDDILNCFDSIHLYYNPRTFRFRSNSFHPAKIEQHNSFDSSKQIIVFQERLEDYETIKAVENSDGDYDEKRETKQRKSKGPIQFVIGFNPNGYKEDIILDSFCILQKFDFDTMTSVSNHKALLGNFQSAFIERPNDNQVYRLNSYIPVSYGLSIASNTKFNLMSVAEYLTQYERWTSKSFEIEHDRIFKNSFCVLGKIKLSSKENSDVIVKLTNIPEEFDHTQMFKYVKYRLIKLNSLEGAITKNYPSEGTSDNLNERIIQAADYMGFKIEAKLRYLLLVEYTGGYCFNDGRFGIEFLTKSSGFNAESIDLTPMIEYTDAYKPNKYGIICRERMFVNDIENLISLKLKLSKFNTGASDGAVDSKAKAPAKGKTGNFSPDNEIELEQLKTIYLEIFEEDSLKMIVSGQNEAMISNISISGNPEHHRNFYIQARFELRECEECKTETEFTSGLHWTLSTCSTNTLCIARDTQKEDKEQALIASWETSEPGRSERAKNSRQIYLLKKSKKRGATLDEEQETLISIPRIERYKVDDAAEKKGAAKDTKKGKPPVKGKTKTGKDEKEESKDEVKQFVKPSSKDNPMVELRDFLRHMESKRTKVEKLLDGESQRIRESSEYDQIFEEGELTKEDTLGKQLLFDGTRETLKTARTEREVQEQQLLKTMILAAQTELEAAKEIFVKLDEKLKSSAEKDLSLYAKLNAEEEISLAEIDNVLSTAENDQIDIRLVKIAKKYRKNLFIKEQITKLEASLEALNIDEIRETMDVIDEHEIVIEDELRDKVEDLYSHIEENPNYLQEKLAEMKKTNKGARKK